MQNFLTVIVLLNSVRLEISELVHTGETVACTSVRTNVLIAETPKTFGQRVCQGLYRTQPCWNLVWQGTAVSTGGPRILLIFWQVEKTLLWIFNFTIVKSLLIQGGTPVSTLLPGQDPSHKGFSLEH